MSDDLRVGDDLSESKEEVVGFLFERKGCQLHPFRRPGTGHEPWRPEREASGRSRKGRRRFSDGEGEVRDRNAELTSRSSSV